MSPVTWQETDAVSPVTLHAVSPMTPIHLSNNTLKQVRAYQGKRGLSEGESSYGGSIVNGAATLTFAKLPALRRLTNDSTFHPIRIDASMRGQPHE
jgi:hypothetical protein